MVELKGSLSGITLLSIFQLIGELHHSGTLHLDQGDDHAMLSFDDGRLVGAESGTQHGVQAVDSARKLTEADFTFIEGAATLPRTLDFGLADLKALLTRVQNGETVKTDGLATVTTGNSTEVEVACRMLGFADDRDRHYSRPTALHRCYASGTPSLVSAQEQRDLCLSGRFATCPRYLNTAVAAARPVARVQSQPPLAVAAEEPPRVISRVAPSRPPGPPRLATPGNQARVTPPPTPPAERLAPAVSEPRLNGAKPVPVVNPPESRRGTVIAGASVLVGLIIVAVAALMLLPRLNRPATPVEQSVTTVAAPTRAAATVVTAASAVAAAGVRATPVPTVAPTATTAVRPATATPVTAPTAAPTARILTDVRFAAGPEKGWVENPPFAGWSDGSYRMQSRQPGAFVAVGIPIDRIIGDVIVNATFRKTAGPPGGGYGVIVRDQGPLPRDGQNQHGNMYVFETGDLGEFGVWRRDDDHWVDLVPWTRTNVVRPGGSPNELGVRAVGNRLSFTVNGTELASVQDGTLVAGGVGVFTGGDYNEVALDRLSIQSPD